MNIDGSSLSKDRSLILSVALALEYTTTEALKFLLGIRDPKTEILGHTTKALGFNQRMLLLLEMKVLDHKHETNVRWMMEMRNQMAHNFHSNNFVECLKYTSFKAEGLLKRFPQDARLSHEDQVTGAFCKLARAALTATTDLSNKVVEFVEAEGERELAPIDLMIERLEHRLTKARLEHPELFTDEGDPGIDTEHPK